MSCRKHSKNLGQWTHGLGGSWYIVGSFRVINADRTLYPSFSCRPNARAHPGHGQGALVGGQLGRSWKAVSTALGLPVYLADSVCEGQALWCWY